MEEARYINLLGVPGWFLAAAVVSGNIALFKAFNVNALFVGLLLSYTRPFVSTQLHRGSMLSHTFS